MRNISKILFDLDIINYSVLDSTLEDKVNALKEGPLPRYESRRERAEVPEINNSEDQSIYEQKYVEEVNNHHEVEKESEDSSIFEPSYENRESRDFLENGNDETLVIDKDSENSNFTDSNSQTINFNYKEKEEE